jgi:hypothetical protein
MPDFWHRSVLSYCALAWFRSDLWMITLLVLVFILLDYLSLRKQVVKITEKQITIPFIIDKDVNWLELNNVILKDDLLTIDFRNNKLFQHLIITSDLDVDEKEFNDFCQQQLNK